MKEIVRLANYWLKPIKKGEYEEQMHTPKAMWDTGANITCISRAVLERLELEPIGEALGGARRLHKWPIKNNQ